MYPLPSGSEDGVAERRRKRRKCGLAHAGGWKIRLDEIRLNQHGCEGHAQGRIIVVVLLLDTALLEADLQHHRGGKVVGFSTLHHGFLPSHDVEGTDIYNPHVPAL